jgi:hypothetical protein
MLDSYGEDFLAPAQPQAVGPLLVACTRLLSQYICIYNPYVEAIFSFRKPEDAPCRGDRETQLVNELPKK